MTLNGKKPLAAHYEKGETNFSSLVLSVLNSQSLGLGLMLQMEVQVSSFHSFFPFLCQKELLATYTRTILQIYIEKVAIRCVSAGWTCEMSDGESGRCLSWDWSCKDCSSTPMKHSYVVLAHTRVNYMHVFRAYVAVI